MFRGTSYAKQAERVQVTPFSSINVFPQYRSTESRLRLSGRDLLRGPVSPTASHRGGGGGGGNSGVATAVTPRRRLQQKQRSSAVNEALVASAKPSAEEQEIIRALESGRVQAARDLPMPDLFAMSP